MKFKLTKDRAEKLKNRLNNYFANEAELTLSDFQTEQLLHFILKDIAPTIYNQAINDVESFVKDKLSDLEGDLKEDEY